MGCTGTFLLLFDVTYTYAKADSVVLKLLKLALDMNENIFDTRVTVKITLFRSVCGLRFKKIREMVRSKIAKPIKQQQGCKSRPLPRELQGYF